MNKNNIKSVPFKLSVLGLLISSFVAYDASAETNDRIDRSDKTEMMSSIVKSDKKEISNVVVELNKKEASNTAVKSDKKETSDVVVELNKKETSNATVKSDKKEASDVVVELDKKETSNKVVKLDKKEKSNAVDKSGKKGKTETPEVPELPETPETPEVPELPETPETPEVPELPETPETPEVPELPETPETPETPEVPELPETPETPEVPELPETPETPEVPELPETPETPEVPELPETPETEIPETTSGTGTSESTDGVLCEYVYDEYNDSESVQTMSSSDWSCDGENRNLVANGIPDHEVGEFPNAGNPNTISEQSVSESFTLTPVESDRATTLGGPRGVTGMVLNGVKIDAGTAGSCDDSGDECSLVDNSGSWSIEALGQTAFDFGDDENGAHVQPDGTYHYHGMPEGFIELQGGNSSTMTLIGWAADGFPIYARYGYSDAADATSEIKTIEGSYQLITDVSSSRPSSEIYSLGTFAQDWEYVEGSGDLDECNGRVGVTPEFPGGIYHYYATDSYPYFQRCVKGEL